MKILLATIEYPPFHGGVANYYGNLKKHWPKTDDFFVLDNANGKLLSPRLIILKWLPSIFALRSLVVKKRIEYVLVGQILPLGTVACLLSFFYHFRYAVILHGMDINLAMKSSRKRCLAKLILNRADKIICNSNYTASRVSSLTRGLENKTFTVYPGVEESPKVSEDAQKEIIAKYDLSKRVVLFSIGRLVERKGFDTVIEALRELGDKYSDIIYLIAGDGPYLGRLRELAGEDKRVVLLGKISNEEKWAWLSVIDVFIMPARDLAGDAEGFGIVYLEAARLGKPSIAGSSGGAGEAVINDLTGLVVRPEKSQVAGAIARLAGDKPLCEVLGRAGRKRVMRDFSWAKQIGKLYSIIVKRI